MRNIIKDKAVVADDWVVLRLKVDKTADEAGDDATNETAENVAIPSGKIIVPLAVWQARQDVLKDRQDVGVWLASSERADALKNDVARLTLIAIDFPRFADGRGYSIAYNLRARLGYQGELRAIGDVLRDQMFYMQRVGFNAFAVREDKDVHDALKSLTDFSEPYQAALDIKAPLFRRVQRTGIEESAK